MKNKIWIMYGVAIATSLLLSGCGTEKAEDVATKYIKLVSKGNIAEAKKIILPSNEELKPLIKQCRAKDLKEKVDNVLKLYRKAFSDHRGRLQGKYKEEYNKGIFKLEKEYGSLLKIPLQNRQDLVSEIINNLAGKDKEVAEMLELIRAKRVDDFVLYAIDSIYQNTDKITPYCALSEIDNIKVLHTELSTDEDEESVKLEVLFKNKKVKKYTLHLENIQNRWKVSGGLFRLIY